jgi:uncharacterized membrane protein YfcA
VADGIGAGDIALLAGAGVLAGICGTVAGLASLASYPALLSVGLSPISANVTNTVALVGNVMGSVFGARPELKGQLERIRRFGLLTLVGGALGAALLLATPSEGFAKIVPFLVGFSALLVLARPRLQRAVEARRARAVAAQTTAADGGADGHGAPAAQPVDAADAHWSAQATIFGLGLYGGYFGAGAGVMMIALLSLVTADILVRVNALKNILLGLANGAAAIGFIVFGPVVWSAAIPLGLGCICGGFVGPKIARAMPATLLRVLIAVAGLYLAVELALDAY